MIIDNLTQNLIFNFEEIFNLLKTRTDQFVKKTNLSFEYNQYLCNTKEYDFEIDKYSLTIHDKSKDKYYSIEDQYLVKSIFTQLEKQHKSYLTDSGEVI